MRASAPTNECLPCECGAYAVPVTQNRQWWIVCSRSGCRPEAAKGINEASEYDAKAAWNRARRKAGGS